MGDVSGEGKFSGKVWNWIYEASIWICEVSVLLIWEKTSESEAGSDNGKRFKRARPPAPTKRTKTVWVCTRGTWYVWICNFKNNDLRICYLKK